MRIMLRVRIAVTALLLAASAVTTGISVTALPYYNDKTGEAEPLLIVTAILWALFALSIVALRPIPVRAAIVLVESLIHRLIERSILSLDEAIEVVETAREVMIEIGLEQHGNAASAQKSVLLIEAIGVSLRIDAGTAADMPE